ncbi:right-handed parallel beta-helix repeat-containing protein [Streptomyces sp. NPDC090080]|uniref:right-handed parallel beta-helix repeat-containing protein n=1 Tax=Streptomyces sp. NPDC090080 TaxID=3365939 RepID=UPI003830DE44
MHRPRPAAALSLAAIAVVGVLSGWGTGAAVADPGSGGTLYVDHDIRCSDSGTGAQSLPFCTVQAAADVAEPGDTVRILGDPLSPYTAPVTVTRSGTSDEPITFSGAPLPPTRLAAVLAAPASAPALTLKGVHDVRVESLTFSDEHHGDVVAVTGSGHVTLDRLTVTNSAPTVPVTGTAIGVDGTSSDVTVSRNSVYPNTAYGVRVAPGAARVTVTTNVILTQQQGGIVVSGATDTDVTGNTVFAPCATAISLDGVSSGVVENNVAAFVGNGSQQTGACPAPTAPLYAVSADSASRVTADYNAVTHQQSSTAAARTEYTWAGTSYPSSGAFRDGTGQGAHDLDGITAGLAAPSEHSPLIDSADATAPGALDTDQAGHARVDDLLVANTGNGTGHPDRGALERQDTLTVSAGDEPAPTQGLAPLGISLKTDATSAWGAALAYSVDFGDGSDPATGTPGTTVAHTYTTPGRYTTRITVTEPDGTTAERSYAGVTAGTAAPPAAALSVAPETSDGQVDAGYAHFTVPMPANPWEVAYRTLDYGDGTHDNLGSATLATHQYPAPGTYTATLTQTDLLGRTTTAGTVFHSADAFVAVTPQYDTQRTIAAHGVLNLSAATLRADAGGVDAAQLQLVTSDAKASGTLTLYAHGTTRPGTAATAFEPGRTTSAVTTVKVTPTGSVDLYNGSSGAVTVDVATVGLQSHAQYADTYHPATPVRLLDTRTGTGATRSPVGGGHSVTLSVGGTHGVPTTARALVLNVTATTTKASGNLTVATHGTGDSAVTGPCWTTGQTVTTQVVIPVRDGKVVLHNASKASANLVADLVGWYGGSTAGGAEFRPVTPVRVLDTRTGTGTGKVARIAAHGTVKIKVTGAHGVPATGVSAADLNLTVPAPSGSGYLVAHPDGTTRPGVYSLSFTKGHTAAGRALVKVGADGAIDLYNAGTVPVDVSADLVGDDLVFPAG